MVNCVSYGSKKSVMEKVDGWYVVIKTDTQWSGTLGNRTVDGRGNSQVNLPENPIWAVCCSEAMQEEIPDYSDTSH